MNDRCSNEPSRSDVELGEKPAMTYDIPYGPRDYTWPTDAKIDRLAFDDTYLNIHLVDGRILSVPLAWIPTLANAKPEDRERYVVGAERKTMHWFPDEGPINEDLRLDTYLK